MPDAYRPLFSRRTLRALLWILPALILLLASLGRDESGVPAIRQTDIPSVYWLEQPDSPANELRLLYVTDIAITPDQRIAQQVLAAGLQSRFEQWAHPVEIDALPDRLQLRLRWPAGTDAPDVRALLTSLEKPLEPAALNAKLERLRALDYLAARAPDQLLMNSYRANLLWTAPPTVTVSALQRQQRVLLAQVPLVLVGGPDAGPLANDAASALPAGNSTSPGTPELLPDDKRLRLLLEDARQPPMQLLGGLTPGRDIDDYAAELLTFGSLQQLLERVPGLQYRLLWQPLRGTGFRALILPGDIEDPRSLLRHSDDALIDSVRQQLLREQRERLKTPEGQLDRLATIVFYRLSDRRLDALVDALEAVAKDDIAARMSHYLEPEPQIRIELNGAPRR